MIRLFRRYQRGWLTRPHGESTQRNVRIASPSPEQARRFADIDRALHEPMTDEWRELRERDRKRYLDEMAAGR